MASLQLLEDSRNPKDDIINISIEYEMCFVDEENFVRNIAVHRLLLIGQLASVLAFSWTKYKIRHNVL